MKAWETATHFRDLIEQEKKITDTLTPDEISDCFDYTYHLKNVDQIFKKIGLA